MKFGEPNICEFCKKEIEDMPYKCSYCDKWFCSDHRLPEKHKCEELEKQSNNSNFYGDRLNDLWKKKKLPYYFYTGAETPKKGKKKKNNKKN